MTLRFQGVIAGQGALVLRCAEEWLSRGHGLAAVISDDPAIASWAAQKGLLVLPGQPAVVPGPSVDCDYIFLIGYPEEQLRNQPIRPRRGRIAYQDSLLPAYAGWHATSWALWHRESVHGITWFHPDAAGPQPLQQVEIQVAPDETAFTLNAKCFDAALPAFARMLDDLEHERSQVLPIRPGAASFFGQHQRPPRAGVLDYAAPAGDLAAHMRALDFADQANPLGLPKLWLGDHFAVVRGITVTLNPDGLPPGAVIALEPQQLAVATGKDAVVLHGLCTLEGEPLLVTELAARYGWARGCVLPALANASAATLQALQEELAPSEADLVARLAAVDCQALPFSMPVARGTAPVWATLEGEGPALPSGTEAMQAAFFLRVLEADQLDLEWQEPGLVLPEPGGSALVARAVPLRAERADQESFTDFARRFALAVQAARQQKTYLRDVFVRYPELRLPAAVRAPVCMTLGFNEAEPDPSTVLRIEIDPAAGRWRWRYNSVALPEARARQLAGLCAAFIRNLARDPGAPLERVPLIDEPERSRLLDQLASPRSDYPVDQDLGEWVDRAARATPDAVAVQLGTKSRTYAQLSEQSNQVAALLQARGAGPDTRIGLCLNRTPETMVALLGIIKAGSCYVPLYPTYPQERLHGMIAHAQLALLLTEPGLRSVLPATGCDVLEIDPEGAWLKGYATKQVRSAASPDHACYVIHTSGSTGVPKGVVMTRRAMLNLVHWQNTVSTPAPNGRTFQYASLSFDVSVQEIFSTWFAGGTLVLVPEDARRDPLHLLRLAAEVGVQRWFMPYAALQQVAAAAEAAQLYPETLRDVITAGEALRITPEIRSFFQRLPRTRLHNQYGPSETHVVTAYVLPGDPASWPGLPSLGRAIATTAIYLLDASGDPVPAGLPGELYVGGDCLAQGYLLRPDLTAERFVTRTWPGRAATRLYRTGDLARQDGDGLIEFMGRRDDQVKIRGYRVELGEVESALSRHAQVREVAVVARERGGVRQLVAYVVAQGGELNPRDLRTFAQGILPDYMVPAAVVLLDKLPLTPSGKIHRRALPEPTFTRSAQDADFRPPQSDIERILGNLWQQVLGLDRVGMGDNFFDLGGDSLKLAKVQAALRTALRRDVPILDLFRFPTIGALARHLGGAEPAEARRSARPARPAASDDAIAVVGLAGRFPGADHVEQLWSGICEGREAITVFRDDELDAPAPELPPNSSLKFIRARGVLEKCEWFDAAFFGYGPRDAEITDPQHRVFLECAWEALEHAGYDPARYPGAIGVYAASSMNTYLMYNVLPTRAAVAEMMQAYQVGGYPTVIGNDKDYVATRVAYKLNLRGPSMAIQTACSSSLVAIGQACQSLAAGACDMALAGGVSITFPQQRGYLYVEGSIASADGHCRPFDAQAAGTVFGSGSGLVVLKRLADAQADGDTVYAVIKGWAINNDGAQKPGFMAPSVEGQAEVIRMALEKAGVPARTIGYVETHCTGTPLGDPIEVAALTKAFREGGADGNGFCAIGTGKTHIGHLDCAPGVTGLIKTLQPFRHERIPAFLHFKRRIPALISRTARSARSRKTRIGKAVTNPASRESVRSA